MNQEQKIKELEEQHAILGEKIKALKEEENKLPEILPDRDGYSGKIREGPSCYYVQSCYQNTKYSSCAGPNRPTKKKAIKAWNEMMDTSPAKTYIENGQRIAEFKVKVIVPKGNSICIANKEGTLNYGDFKDASYLTNGRWEGKGEGRWEEGSPILNWAELKVLIPND